MRGLCGASSGIALGSRPPHFGCPMIQTCSGHRAEKLGIHQPLGYGGRLCPSFSARGKRQQREDRPTPSAPTSAPSWIPSCFRGGNGEAGGESPVVHGRHGARKACGDPPARSRQAVLVLKVADRALGERSLPAALTTDRVSEEVEDVLHLNHLTSLVATFQSVGPCSRPRRERQDESQSNDQARPAHLGVPIGHLVCSGVGATGCAGSPNTKASHE